MGDTSWSWASRGLSVLLGEGRILEPSDVDPVGLEEEAEKKLVIDPEPIRGASLNSDADSASLTHGRASGSFLHATQAVMGNEKECDRE